MRKKKKKKKNPIGLKKKFSIQKEETPFSRLLNYSLNHDSISFQMENSFNPRNISGQLNSSAMSTNISKFSKSMIFMNMLVYFCRNISKYL
jgi:hypothetical protein